MRQNHRRFRLDVWGWTTIAILLLYGLFCFRKCLSCTFYDIQNFGDRDKRHYGQSRHNWVILGLFYKTFCAGINRD